MRDRAAAALLAIGVTPNAVSVAGLVVTCGGSACLVVGAGDAAAWLVGASGPRASWWPVAAAGWLSLAGVLDVLDGAVARVGGLVSRFGGILDSTLDRCSDAAIFCGCALHFSLAGNQTFLVLSLAALANSLLVSYVKARTECVIERCGFGFWQRPERCVTFMLGALLGHIPVVLCLLATLPWLTVLRRLRDAARLTAQQPPWTPPEWMRPFLLWRHPRGTLGYDLCALATILLVTLGPNIHPFLGGQEDPLARIIHAAGLFDPG